jgi:hypothetical protein
MMKKLTALVMLLVMALCCCTAQADETMQKFQPYTTVKMDVLEKYGFTTNNYDDFAFTAELTPENNKISDTVDGLWSDTYSIRMDVKVVYSEIGCVAVPRLIFTRSGEWTYSTDRMEEVYIRIGENRYKVDVSDCSRSSSSKSSTATDRSVEMVCDIGALMLKDIANTNEEVNVKFSGHSFTLTSADKKALTTFYNACVEAGIFEQTMLEAMTDDYSIITLFNN